MYLPEDINDILRQSGTEEELRAQKLLPDLAHKEKFFQLGVVEKVGKTSGTKYMLSHRYYSHEERPGIYTRIRGISRDQKKQLILEHIKREGIGKMGDFLDVFPELKRKDINNILQELKQSGQIKAEGITRSAVWKLVK